MASPEPQKSEEELVDMMRQAMSRIPLGERLAAITVMEQSFRKKGDFEVLRAIKAYRRAEGLE